MTAKQLADLRIEGDDPLVESQDSGGQFGDDLSGTQLRRAPFGVGDAP
ncbi:hypothetical protein [Nocardia sp. NBC_01388]